MHLHHVPLPSVDTTNYTVVDRIDASGAWNVRAMAATTWPTVAKAVQWKARKAASRNGASKRTAGR